MSAPAHKQPFPKRDEELDRCINLKLAALGLPVSRSAAGSDFLQIAGPLLRNYYQKDRQLGNSLCASDSRIQDFLDAYLSDVCPQGAARLPGNTFVLDREGMARVLSLPVTSDSFSSPYVDSYRLPQGMLHNPRSDKRTTQGLFHIAEGGLPIPADKAAVPKQAFAALWRAALTPPDDLLTLPFTADQEDPARCFVSLLLRPLVCPAASAGRTWRIRENCTWPKSPPGWRAEFPRPGRFTCRSTRCWREEETVRPIPRPACRRWRRTAPSITRNCRSCSWISSAA